MKKLIITLSLTLSLSANADQIKTVNKIIGSSMIIDGQVYIAKHSCISIKDGDKVVLVHSGEYGRILVGLKTGVTCKIRVAR